MLLKLLFCGLKLLSTGELKAPPNAPPPKSIDGASNEFEPKLATTFPTITSPPKFPAGELKALLPGFFDTNILPNKFPASGGPLLGFIFGLNFGSTGALNFE